MDLRCLVRQRNSIMAGIGVWMLQFPNGPSPPMQRHPLGIADDESEPRRVSLLKVAFFHFDSPWKD